MLLAAEIRMPPKSGNIPRIKNLLTEKYRLVPGFEDEYGTTWGKNYLVYEDEKYAGKFPHWQHKAFKGIWRVKLFENYASEVNFKTGKIQFEGPYFDIIDMSYWGTRVNKEILETDTMKAVYEDVLKNIEGKFEILNPCEIEIEKMLKDIEKETREYYKTHKNEEKMKEELDFLYCRKS